MNTTTKNTTKKTSESIEECLKNDEISGAMWNWANRLQNLSIISLILYLIIGLITAIALCAETDENEFLVIVICFASAIFLAIPSYTFYKILALLIASKASILHNTKITAKLTEYSVRKNFLDSSYEIDANIDTDDEPATKQIIRSQTGWICPECAREYTNDIDSCTCGYQKP